MTKFTGLMGELVVFRALGDITGKEIKCRTTYRFIFKKHTEIYIEIYLYIDL